MKPLDYYLPQEKIAIRPLENRSDSKLLVYKDGQISDNNFKDLPSLLPNNSHVFLNNTKVLKARILLQKPTGAKIELFLLEPYLASGYPYGALDDTDQILWKAFIGGASKFKTNQPLSQVIEIDGRSFPIFFEKVKALEEGFLVSIYWENPNPEQYTFSEILPLIGYTPIPPYLNRMSEDIDSNRYQTIYAKNEGSVAAPTSSLHYDEAIFKKFKALNIHQHELTLHVGAGTFKPITSEDIAAHHMHQEWMQIQTHTIQSLISILKKEEPVIASGTTSARFLESLYWLGVYIHENKRQPEIIDQVFIKKHWNHSLTALESLEIINAYWEANDIQELSIPTTIFIYPPYAYRMITALITNFHQPQSTLLLLVAAFVGKNWEEIYNYALCNNFRFLSYGDASLLFGSKKLSQI